MNITSLVLILHGSLFIGEPNVLASQGKQLFYVKKIKWFGLTYCYTYAMTEEVSSVDSELYQQFLINHNQPMHEFVDNGIITWNWNDVIWETIHINLLLSRQKETDEGNIGFINDDDLKKHCIVILR